jgi:large subunit ribosomal protein L34e
VEKDHAAKMVQRLTYRRRHSYATKSNKQRVLRTPGAWASSTGRRDGQGGASSVMGAGHAVRPHAASLALTGRCTHAWNTLQAAS